MTIPDADDALLSALAAAMRDVSGPPTSAELAAADAARQRIGGHDEAIDFAELAFDSLLDEAALMRGVDLAEARHLAFYADEGTVRIDVTRDLLVCTVDALAPQDVMLVAVSGTRHVLSATGGDGYELADVPVGLVRLECETQLGRMVTAWFRL